MNRYENCKIYKLVNNVDDEIYVGSTCNTLAKRLHKHKKDAKRRPDQHVYKHLDSIGWNNVQCILIEEYPCENKNQQLARERYWYDQLKPTLNMYRPSVTDEELKEYEKDRHKNYYENNREKVLERRRQPWHCEACQCTITSRHKSRHLKGKTHLLNAQKQEVHETPINQN